MTETDVLDELIQELDSLRVEKTEDIDQHQTEVWNMVVGKSEVLSAMFHRRERRIGPAIAAGTAVLLALALVMLPSGNTPSAAAAMLTTAASKDAGAASLPNLGAGQYYYQSTKISMVCSFFATGMSGQINFLETGTMQSWTTKSGAGKIVVTPARTGANGSHFASTKDYNEWVAAGKPFIPCALGTSSNQLINSHTNSDPHSAKHVQEAVMEYTGFGSMLSGHKWSTVVSAGSSVNDLPSSPSTTSSMMADGQISPMGTISTHPTACPVPGSTGSGSTCSNTQQMGILESLLQLPDASYKLGSVLYGIAAANPTAQVAQSPDPATGDTIESVSLSPGLGQEFQISLDATSGSLVSCAIMQPGQTTPEAQLTYGPVEVVSHLGGLPASPAGKVGTSQVITGDVKHQIPSINP